MTKAPAFLAFATALFAILIVTVPAQPLALLLSGAFLFVAAALTVTMAPYLWAAFWAREMGAPQQLAFGIALIWSAVILSRLLNAYGRATDSLDAVAHSPGPILVTYLAIWGAGLTVAPLLMSGRKILPNRWVLLGAIGGGAILALGFGIFQALA